jgi:hypothetical protein
LKLGSFLLLQGELHFLLGSKVPFISIGHLFCSFVLRNAGVACRFLIIEKFQKSLVETVDVCRQRRIAGFVTEEYFVVVGTLGGRVARRDCGNTVEIR